MAEEGSFCTPVDTGCCWSLTFQPVWQVENSARPPCSALITDIFQKAEPRHVPPRKQNYTEAPSQKKQNVASPPHPALTAGVFGWGGGGLRGHVLS